MKTSQRPNRLSLRLAGIALLIAVAGLVGCIPSLDPIYTDKDLVFDPAIVGTWGDPDKPGDSWAFAPRDATSYRLTIQNDGKSSPFVARLVQLGSHRFLDLYPEEGGLNNVEGFYRAAIIPGHLFLKVAAIDPALQLSLLDLDWLAKLLASDPTALRHHRNAEGKPAVLTASTQELQAFLIKHADSPGAFADPSNFCRRPTATP